ncbi:hypothetical protein F5051DRAFT_471010 [Lentinula edodes]|nr:hypothetical protein F5051DRAFT_471010 [Lentinula edodes]
MKTHGVSGLDTTLRLALSREDYFKRQWEDKKNKKLADLSFWYYALAQQKLTCRVKTEQVPSSDWKHQARAMEESPLTNGLVVQIRSASSKQGKTNSPIWFVHGGKGLISPQYGELGSLDREAELEAAYPSWESFVQSYEPLLPLRSAFIGGWSSGGNIALLLAAEHVRKSRPVKGVILLDSYTGDGFIPTKEHKTDYPDDPAKARAYTQMNHIEKLLVTYPEPESSELEGIPVLPYPSRIRSDG